MTVPEVAGLLGAAPLPLETGYRHLPDGVLHVAVRTDLHGCTGEMFEWWFRWRCDTQKYVWWHPVDHVASAWRGDLRDDTHVGSEHIVTERLTDQPAADLLIQFRDPTEFFDADAYRSARETGAVTSAVVARITEGHDGPRTEDGAVLGGRMAHIGRDTPWGLALRSHFFLGYDLPQLGASPEDVEALFPAAFGQSLLQHAYNEFTFLSRFLPSLYIAENRDVVTPKVPW